MTANGKNGLSCGTATSAVSAFIGLLQAGLEAKTFIKLVLGKYRGPEAELRNLVIRPVKIREQERLAIVSRYRTRDVTRHVTIDEGIALVSDRLGKEFKSANLFSTTENAQIEFNKKGHPTMSISKPTCEEAPDHAHDRSKERLIDPRRPFLKALGVTRSNGQVVPSMSRKWKQINVFLDLFRGALEASGIDRTRPVTVVDFGSGKGYLTFAVYDYLVQTLGVAAEVTGVEIRDELVRFCRGAAESLGMTGLHFETGDLTSRATCQTQVMIALHACDTATDRAIRMGVEAGAEIIMCAPCCHKELRPQMGCPDRLAPLLKFGVHQGLVAEMLTDTLRALWLEAAGYAVQVFEFISLEHTSKNKMILAVKRTKPSDPAPIIAQMEALKTFFGITSFAQDRSGSPSAPIS